LLEQARDMLNLATAISGKGEQQQVVRGSLSLICFQDLGSYYARDC